MTGEGDTPKEKAERLLKALHSRDDVAHNSSEVKLDPETFKYMLDNGLLLQLKQNDLEPGKSNDAYQYSDGVKTYPNTVNPDGTFKIPIYVVPGIGDARNNFELLEVSGNGSGAPKQLFLADEGAHIYNIDYYRAHMMQSDEEVRKTQPYIDEKIKEESRVKLDDPKKTDETLNYISEESKRLGIKTPTLILDENRGGEYAFESKEGTKYLRLSYDDFPFENASEGRVNDWKKAVNEQLARIKEGKTSPEYFIEKREGERLISSSLITNTSVTPDDIRVSNSALSELVKNEKLTRLKPDELTETAKADPAFQDKNIPIYRVKDGHAVEEGFLSFEAKLMHTKEGKPYILTNQRAEIWTEENIYAKAGTVTDASILRDIQDGTYMTANGYHNTVFSAKSELYTAPDKNGKMRERPSGVELARFNAFMNDLKEKAELRGLVGEPTLLIGEEQASTRMSREGHTYIYISRDELQAALKSDEGLANAKTVMEHELDHIQYKYTSPSVQIQIHNSSDPVMGMRVSEINADLGIRDPKAFARYLKAAENDYASDYSKADVNANAPLSSQYQKTGILTDYDRRKLSDAAARYIDRVHPTMENRIDAALDAAQIRQDYQKTHVVATEEDRKQEDRFVNAKVKQDMNGLWQLSMPAANLTLPPDGPSASLPHGKMNATAPEMHFHATQKETTSDAPARPVGLPAHVDLQIAVPTQKAVDIAASVPPAPVVIKNPAITLAPATKIVG